MMRSSLLLIWIVCAYSSAVHAGSSPLEQHFATNPPVGLGCSHCQAETTDIYIEVVPGLGQALFEVFDPEAVAGGTPNFDSNTGDTQFELFDPSGTKVSGFSCAGATCVCDVGFTCGSLAAPNNRWVTLFTAGAPAPGHWRLTSDVPSNNGVNGYRVRAHDGDPGAGGTELNIYFQNAFTPGNSNADPNPTSFVHYPYMVGGCEFRQNDFDIDSTNGQAGAQSIALNSRSGAFSQTLPNALLSGNGVWGSNVISGFATPDAATDYGVWQITTTLNGLSQNNRSDAFIGRFNGLDPTGLATIPGGLQNQTNTFRVYGASDAGTAPQKPYLTHQLTSTNVSLLNNVTRHTVTVSFVNPTAFPVTFDATDTVLAANNDGVSGANVVTSHVPSNPVLSYVMGSATVSAGIVVSQPAGASGDVVWDPGMVAAGTTVTLSYAVDVLPTAVASLLLTGTPATSNGTDAELTDETGQLDLYLGALCELSLTPVSGSASIGDRIFEDIDLDGGFDVGEGLGGVTVNLSGLDGAGNAIALNTTTAADGSYAFSGLPNGTYTVTVDQSTLPTALQGNNTVDPDGGGDGQSSVSVATSEVNNSQDFGFVRVADIQISKTLLDSAPFFTGQTINYQIVVTNNGPSAAQSVVVSDTPASLSSVTITNPAVCTGEAIPDSVFDCVIANIPPTAGSNTVVINVTAVVD